eukprot:1144311-Pelagomonas_calceolata.AAC.8
MALCCTEKQTYFTLCNSLFVECMPHLWLLIGALPYSEVRTFHPRQLILQWTHDAPLALACPLGLQRSERHQRHAGSGALSEYARLHAVRAGTCPRLRALHDCERRGSAGTRAAPASTAGQNW